jgi:hypothetical protein
MGLCGKFVGIQDPANAVPRKSRPPVSKRVCIVLFQPIKKTLVVISSGLPDIY